MRIKRQKIDMENSIRWGFWGTGAIAHAVASDFPLVRDASLYAVGSRTPSRAKEFAAEHGATRWYGSLDALLHDADVDAVYVATPNHCHLEDCLACITAGKSVLCEKPFALNVAQAQLIADAARANRVFCMEAMWTRFIPAVMDVKRRIDRGDIGSVRLMQGNFAYPAERTSVPRLFDIKMGGGVLLDRGVYLISLIQHLVGEPKSIRGTAVIGPTGVDEQSSYELIFGDNATASMTASLLVRGSNDLFIAGERGSLRLLEPFYCAHSYERRGIGALQSAQEVGSSRRGFVQRLRSSPFLKGLVRRSSPLREMIRVARISKFPFAGNGYQFQLMEVNCCLKEKMIESNIMPLSDSIAVMKMMDVLRSQWGMVYSQERTEL